MGNLTAKTSGEIASFMSPSMTNIKSLKVHFSPKQLGTGDPSPENVREIEGWDGVKAYNDPKYSGNIVWNQCFDLSTLKIGSGTSNNFNVTKLDTGFKVTTNTDVSGSGSRVIYFTVKWNRIQNHRYIFLCKIKSNTLKFSSVYFYHANGSSNRPVQNSTGQYAMIEIYTGSTATTNASPRLYIYGIELSKDESFEVTDLMAVDLDMMFGTTVIDNLFNNTTTALQRVDWFTSIITNYDYHDYNEGEITTVSAVNNEPYTNLLYQWKKLPDEYQEVEYIESDGGQYIDTGILPSSTDVYSFKGEFPNKDNSVLFGCRSSGTYRNSNQLYLNRNVDKNIKSVMLIVNTASSNNTEYTKNIFFYNGDNLPLEIDEKNISINGRTSESFNPTQSIYLLGFNVLGTNSITVGGGKLVYFKIDGRCNFIPCYRKSDNEIGMYDTVSQTFYTNQGTGEFLKGEDVFCNTAYGGYIDLISGELVEEYGYVKLEDLNWTVKNNNRIITNDLSSSILSPSYSVTVNIIGEQVQPAKYSMDLTKYPNAIACSSNGQLIKYYDGENPQGLMAYQLATPITHQLTPTQLKSFVGQNNFWSNADYVEVEYELKETEDIQKCRKKIILNQPHIESVKGDLVNFTTNMKTPLKECKVYFEPIQEGEGDPSPDNVRPISGWEGVQLTQANENLIPESLPDNVIKGTPSGSKIATASNARIFAIPIPKNTPLHIQKKSGDTSGSNIGLLEDGEPQVGDAWINNKGLTNAINQDYPASEYSWMGINASSLQVTEEWFTTRELMVSVGNTRKEYVAPKGYSTRYISWQSETGIVYGGTLDVLSGELSVDRYAEDLSQKSWKVRYTGNEHITLSTSLTNAYPRAKGNQIISENYALDSVAGASILSDPDNVNIGLYWYNNAASLKSAVIYVVANVNVIPSGLVVYPLAEPITIQLTPQQLLTLKGTNNIWSNSNGQTEVKFWTHIHNESKSDQDDSTSSIVDVGLADSMVLAS